jgi:hypothetical protein
MVISLSPSGRDSKFNDLATLKIKHTKGSFTTPNRLVTKNDHTAKDEIGADIPLTRTSQSFMVQENIDSELLDRILNENGFLQKVLSKTSSWSQKIGNKNSLVFLYPHLTKDAAKILDTSIKRKKFSKFFGNLAISLGLESILVPVLGEIEEVTSAIDLNKLQIIPVIDLQEETEVFSKKFEDCKELSAEDNPLMAFKFAPYPKANIAYDTIMEDFEKIHEKSKGVMIVDAERNLKYSNQPNVSGPHYGSLIMADLIAERYKAGGGGKKPTSVRLFCKNDLVTIPNVSNNIEEKFDLKSEKQVFKNDSKMQELLERIVNDQITDVDWKHNRPSYLSRVHENARTRPEFDSLQKNIDSETTLDYIEEKKDMGTVIKDHLKERLK